MAVGNRLLHDVISDLIKIPMLVFGVIIRCCIRLGVIRQFREIGSDFPYADRYMAN